MKNLVIIYDGNCPACAAYTSAFVKVNLIKKENRVAYCTNNHNKFFHLIDFEKAKDEIPVIDLNNNLVWYGLDGLIIILAQKIKFLAVIFRFKPFHWLFKQLYFLISYNRRLIAPRSNNSYLSLEPHFNLKYRILYLLFTWLFSSFILTIYSTLLTLYIGKAQPGRELLICATQLLFQGSLFLFMKNKSTKMADYLGNMMTVSLIGSLLLLPALLIHNFFSELNSLFYLIWFTLVVFIMLFEHKRRVQLLHLPLGLTITWLLYRIIVLILIL